MENDPVFLIKEFHITQKVVDDFITFSGDCNFLHTDDEWTARNTRFPRRIVHGAIINAYVSKCITEHFGNGTVYVEHLVRYKGPVYIGDTILIALRDKDQHTKLTKFITDVVISESDYKAEPNHNLGSLVASGHAIVLEKSATSREKS